MPTQTYSAPKIALETVQLFLDDIDINERINLLMMKITSPFHISAFLFLIPKNTLPIHAGGLKQPMGNNKRQQLSNIPKLPPGNYTFRVRASINDSF